MDKVFVYTRETVRNEDQDEDGCVSQPKAQNTEA